jgi:hypothetical protein
MNPFRFLLLGCAALVILASTTLAATNHAQLAQRSRAAAQRNHLAHQKQNLVAWHNKHNHERANAANHRNARLNADRLHRLAHQNNSKAHLLLRQRQAAASRHHSIQQQKLNFTRQQQLQLRRRQHEQRLTQSVSPYKYGTDGHRDAVTYIEPVDPTVPVVEPSEPLPFDR